MQIYGPAHVHGPQAISAPHTTRAASSTSQVESPKIQDEVNISDAARLVEAAKQAPDIRQDRVQSIRARLPPAPTRLPASSTRPSAVCWTRSGNAPPSRPAKPNSGVWPQVLCLDTISRSSGMAWLRVFWDLEPGGNAEHVADHGLDMDEVEHVLMNPTKHGTSRSSGHPQWFSDTRPQVITSLSYTKNWTKTPSIL